jgi:post-segregation antitoxin (ccd killing protein)
MTSQSPRIYIYKITFEEVLYYYYGVHKEKKFGEYYMGSPKTHKWCWDFYTPKKQILQVFEFSEEGWLEAQEVEKRLIRTFFNTDKWCLNENCGGLASLKILKENAIKGGIKAKELGVGIYSLTNEERIKIGKKNWELGVGIHGLTCEEKKQYGKKGAEINRKNKTGIFGLSKNDLIENGSKGGKISGKMNADNKTGVCGRTREKMTEDGEKGGKISGKISGKKNVELSRGIFSLTTEERKRNSSKGGVQSAKKQKELGIGMFALTKEQLSRKNRKSSLQRWKCTETGYISNASGLSKYQKKRGIDKSKRVRLS